jgi:hypothetical protein
MDINNPERWKEFGARIQTEGEKVAITFRNQRVEFERTIEGAKNAIAQLGTMKGVEGTIEVISPPGSDQQLSGCMGADAQRHGEGQRRYIQRPDCRGYQPG